MTAGGRRGGDVLPPGQRAVVLVGQDSADPGTTIARLLAVADRLEYLALVATPGSEVRGAVPALLGRLLAVPGRTLAASRMRVWDRNEAEAMGGVEQSVTQAIDWMGRHGLLAVLHRCAEGLRIRAHEGSLGNAVRSRPRRCTRGRRRHEARGQSRARRTT